MKRNFALVAVAAATLGSGVSWHYATEHASAPAQVYAQKGAPSLTFAPMVKKVTPAVVNVSSSRTIPVSNRNRRGGQPTPEDLFREFFGGRGGMVPGVPEQPRRQEGAGSGVIVSPDGYILTNAHVVEGADDVSVSLADRREFTAKVVGADPQTDVAVLKIEATNLPTLQMPDTMPAVGDLAFAIGNPFSIGQTVTMGIISATGRAGLNPENYEDFLQTDAAINPGNSGGALVNTHGELIGINTAILAGRSGGNQGIGFAIPINMARQVMDQLIKTGKVVRGYLGTQIQPVTPELARAFKLKSPRGAVLTRIEPGTPAAKAGLQPGDVVLSVNGDEIVDDNALRLRISQMAPGSTAKLGIQRADGPHEITVTLAQLPGDLGGAPTDPELRSGARSPLEGVSVDALDPQTAEQLQLPPTAKGVVVTNVEPNSEAYRQGLRRGDVIQSVNRKPVASPQEFEAAVRSGESVLLLVNRGGGSRFVVIEPRSTP
jgi:serine protease Do